jgi:hypothetical protein
MKTPLFNQSRCGAAVSICVVVRKVYSRASTSSPREAREHVGAAVSHTSGLDVEQLPAVGPQRVADVAERGAVGQDDLPVGAGARHELPIELGTGEGAARERDDAAMAGDGLAEIERFGNRRRQPVHLGQLRLRKLIAHHRGRSLRVRRCSSCRGRMR